ncbi:MAG: RNA polymerase sigma factor [Flavisolibacter sp.]
MKKTLMDLKVILKGCLARKTRHQKLFYEQFYAYALRIAFRYIDEHEQAAFLVNETFAKLFLDVDFFELSGKNGTEAFVKNYIKKQVVYKAIDKLFVTFVTDIESAIDLTKITAFHLSHENSNPQDQIIFLLKYLPQWHRILINMHVIDGFSLLEIARHFNTSVSACTVDLIAARAFLEKLMPKAERPFLSLQQTMSIAK